MSNSTVTVKSSSGDYVSLNAAFADQAANYPNLTSNCNNTGSAGILTIECHNFEDTTAANTGTAWTVSSSYYINIVAADSHKGRYGTDAYRLTNAGTCLIIAEQYTRCVGLQVKSSGSIGIQWETGTANCVGDRCIVSSAGISYRARNNSGTVYWKNCVGYSSGNSVFYQPGNGGNHKAYSCSGYTPAASAGVFASTGYAFVCKNCYGAVSGAGATAFSVTSMTNCISSDASAGSSNGCVSSIAFDTTNFTSVSDDLDLHLVAGSDLIDAGTDTSEEDAPLDFSIDIDGVTRTGTWDVGADEYVAAAGGGGAAIFNPYDEVII